MKIRPAHTVELLAPARDYDTARAAVDYGADALYMGGPRFGARYAAGNSIDDLARAVEYAHRYGVRVHCTLNTIIYDEELREAERTAREVVAAGVDALIVQDLAFRRMDLPPVELHASTQMCNMTPEWVRFLEQAGFSRVILERGLTREQIRAIRAATGVELECFVHGAICVGHSGRCMLSRTMSSRSGNRGECSQPCRLTYDLIDSNGRKLRSGKHLLSVRDLDLSSHIGELIDDGILATLSETYEVGAVGKGEYTPAADPCTDSGDWAYIQGKGKLVVGITDYKPMDYRDENGNWIGFDADYARAVAAKLRVEVEFKEIEWDYKLVALEAKDIDCIWNGMTITDAIEAAADCTAPYMYNTQVAVVKKANLEKYKTIADFAGAKLAAEGGSAGEKVIKDNAQLASGLKSVTGQTDALMEVLSGASDAAIVDLTLAKALIG